MEFVDITKKQPELNSKKLFKFNRHRYGVLHSTDEAEGVYMGVNTITNLAMVQFEYEDDECFTEITHWKELTK